MSLPLVFSLKGTFLSDEEAAFFKEYPPYGYILFARNVESPPQLLKLTQDLKSLSVQDTHILIDQEGGRVQRMKAPHWTSYPCMNECDDEGRVRTVISSIAQDLKQVGITTNCAPVLDVLRDETDVSIGDRAFSHNVDKVSDLGLIACEVFLEHGIQPIVKHLPGHGRAQLDAHVGLPRIEAPLSELEESDFLPFQRVRKHVDIGPKIQGMIAHCLYTQIDPDLPATLSERVIGDVIRGRLGYQDILLFSDDLSMGALDAYGDLAVRTQKCLKAGCDIGLYCAGNLDEMKHIVSAF